MSSFLISNSEINYLNRIDRFFDCVYIDEVQDFESYDFDWIISLSKLNAQVWLLGDFYQKTYSTSRDGNKGSGIHKNVSRWLKELESFELDNESLVKSHRCPDSVCNFVRENLNISIYHVDENVTQSIVKLVEDEDEINRIMTDSEIKKLFYQKHYD